MIEITSEKTINVQLDYKGFEPYLKEKTIFDFGRGVAYKFRFENGYGANVIKHRYSYGYELDMWEIGVVISYDENHAVVEEFSNVFEEFGGFLSNDEVLKELKKIQSFPANSL